MNTVYKDCRKNNTSAIIRYISDYPEFDINSCNCFGDTLLTIACKNNNIDLVKFLLEQPKIDMNKYNSNQETPLYKACQYEYIDLIKLLLADDKINVNLKNSRYDNEPLSETAFFAATIASDENRLEIIKILLDDPRIDINEPDCTGLTPLSMLCSDIYCPESIELLLDDPRTDIFKSTNNGFTVFHSLCTYHCVQSTNDNNINSYMKIIQRLLENQHINVNSSTVYGALSTCPL